MVPIRFQVVGEEDYALVVEIGDDGEYMISSGTYTSERPRRGRLTREQENRLLAAIEELGLPREHPAPPQANAFMAQLTVGREGETATYSFWEGALESDEKLSKVVRLLELL